MSPQQRHRDVAAYALDALEPADALHVEDHLAHCIPCTLLLGDFARLAALLAPYAGPRPRAQPPLERPTGALLVRLLDEVAALRGRARGRRLRLASIVAALIVTAPVGAYALTEPARRTPAPAAPVARTWQASHPTTGVRARLTLVDRAWGTEVALAPARVPGPAACELVAVGRDGTTQTVLTWTVPHHGRSAADLRGGTGLHRADIARFEIRDGDGTRLVTVTRAG
ncbi:hypothetical protein ACFWIA_21585 [Streptomyces sp. NPDC127068]|uniref:hypothetical protein n=1 Tax=Streptomyces sp. NPDC127068 TaxID=3347127 RepID=UPI003668FCE5